MAKQNAKMMALRICDGILVKVIQHLSLNFAKGVVYARELLRYFVEELIEALAEQRAVERVSRKSNCVCRWFVIYSDSKSAVETSPLALITSQQLARACVQSSKGSHKSPKGARRLTFVWHPDVWWDERRAGRFASQSRTQAATSQKPLFSCPTSTTMWKS